MMTHARSSWFQRLLLPGLAFKAVVIGGGYATGRELAEFFLPSGPWGGLAGMLLATLIWSAKESVLKALKVGLRMDTRRISVNIRFEPLDSPQWRQFCAAIADGPTFFGAWVRADGWIRSIASCSSPLPYLSELSH